jgi:hypothetical protein
MGQINTSQTRKNTWSRLNGRKGSGNSNPNFSGFNSQEGQPRGHRSSAYRDLLYLALDRKDIVSLSATPSLDFLRQCVEDDDLRAELRITAASALTRFEAHPKASRPYVPALPAGFTIPRLTTVAACQEALAIITASVIEGTLALDAADYLRKHVEAVLPSLETSEVRQEIAAFKELVESAEQRTIDHEPLPPPAE